MSVLPSVRPEAARAVDAIAQAARATGVDFGFLLAQARSESGLDPDARAATSSAAGLFQFLSGTWLDLVARHGGRAGLGAEAAALRGGRLDAGGTARLLALRDDPETAALFAGFLAADNAAALTASLGRTPDAAELHLAHVFGPAGAARFLAARAADGGQPGWSVLPAAARANPGLFGSAAAPRSLDAIHAHLAERIGGGEAAPVAPAQPAAEAAAPPRAILAYLTLAALGGS